MSTYFKKFEIDTKGFTDIKDITSIVGEILKESNVKEGVAVISVPGSTASITTIEYEPGLLRDLPEILEKVAPQSREYFHNETWHDGNGFAHIRASIMGPSLSIPIHNGDLVLGTWQQIVLVDFDNRSRRRNVVVQIVGE